MFRISHALIAVVLLCIPFAVAFAQLGGSRVGTGDQAHRPAEPPHLTREVAETFITVEGRAALRIPPSEIRIVLAVTSDGEAAQQCQQSIRKTVDELRDAWRESGVEPESIVEDFIAVLPRYEWAIEQRAGVDVGVERKAGYQMQTNLHVAVPNEERAETALAVAFERGVTDIIAFDYWSDQIDELKVQARAQAVESARNKAEFLMGELLESMPPAINVQEETTVHTPESLYQSFTNSLDQEVTPAPRRDVPLFGASRPRNTYYRGLASNADVEPGGLPMRPEITVVSTVKIYYESPAAQKARSAARKGSRQSL